MNVLDVIRRGRTGRDLVQNTTGPGRFAKLLKQVVCKDGTTISVQASQNHYCSPRNDYGPWYAVEVGFPSVCPEPWAEWATYCEDKDKPTETVYGWVPVSVVEQFVEAHGGVDDGLSGAQWAARMVAAKAAQVAGEEA